jgi:hypothetical protein
MGFAFFGWTTTVYHPDSGTEVKNFEKRIAGSCSPHMKTPGKVFLVEFNGSIAFLYFE